MTWQPIETAPRWTPEPGANIFTGKPEVILGWVGGDVHMGYWQPARGGDGSWDQTGDGFWQICGGGFVAGEPTHWMPLPEPPEAQK